MIASRRSGPLTLLSDQPAAAQAALNQAARAVVANPSRHTLILLARALASFDSSSPANREQTRARTDARP